MDIGGLVGDIITAPFLCIGWLIIGFIAGALARRIMGSPNRWFWSDILLGIVGAWVGGFIASLFNLYQPDGGISYWIANIVIATIGAIILIGIGNRVFGGARRAGR